jgi:hypothetical protein
MWWSAKIVGLYLKSGHEYHDPTHLLSTISVSPFFAFYTYYLPSSQIHKSPLLESEATKKMPRSSPQAPLQRHDLDVVKQQLVVLVSVVTTVIVLCPEWLQFYRNLCAIPLLAWLTSRAFDFVIKLDKAWDSAPAMVKYFVPVDFPTITPPYEQIRGLTRRRLDIASIKLRRFASEMRRVLLALVNWILCQMPRGKCY